jgi:hypothetical protein
MKKLNPWLFLSLFVAAFTLSACGDDKDDNPPKDEKIEVTEANLKGTWDGSVERDFAQGYYQRWRVQFDGKNYTAWHTHQIVGTINDQDMSLKTVGNKEQGTWEYKDDILILTPKKMWASHYLTAKTINDPYYTVYLDYNPETMECTEWYETSEYIIQQGIERDLEDGINGNEMTISVWSVASLTKTDLTVRINKDVFKLNKK